MKKILIAFLCFTATAVKAQDKSSRPLHLDFGATIAAPAGKTTANDIKFQVGGDLLLRYQATNRFALTASAGFDVWNHAKGKTYNYVPLLAGVRFNITDKFFFSEQAGYALGVSKDFNVILNPPVIKGAFTDLAGFGYHTGSRSDVMIGYKGMFYKGASRNAVFLRLGYHFGK